MPILFRSIFRFIRLLRNDHQAVAIENVALRLQLARFNKREARRVDDL